MQNNDGIVNWDEIRQFIDCRYISAMEACWRLFEFKLGDRTHAVMALPVHMPDYHPINFDEFDNVDKIIEALDKPTKLTAYYILNSNHMEARQYRFYEILEHFTWETRQHIWRPRVQVTKMFGCMVEVSPLDLEKCCLRLLLSHVSGATSFESLRTVDDTNMIAVCDKLYGFACIDMLCGSGVVGQISELWERHRADLIEDFSQQYQGNDMFAETRALMGIADVLRRNGNFTLAQFGLPATTIADKELIIKLLQDNSLNKIGSNVAGSSKYSDIIKNSENPKNEKSANNENKKKHQPEEKTNKITGSKVSTTTLFTSATKKAQIHLGKVSLNTEITKIKSYIEEKFKIEDFNVTACPKRENAKNFAGDEQSLNEEKREIFHLVMSAIKDNNIDVPDDFINMFYVDASGGTGKTFLFNTLLKTLRIRRFDTVTIAWTGIAASLLLAGKTAHKAFRLPLNTENTGRCGFPIESERSNYIKNAKLIVWDEAPMSPKYAISLVNNYLRAIMQKPRRPMGGKIVIFGSDFRQILPVVSHGHRTQIVATSFKASPLWPLMRKCQLHENIRAGPDEREFRDFDDIDFDDDFFNQLVISEEEDDDDDDNVPAAAAVAATDATVYVDDDEQLRRILMPTFSSQQLRQRVSTGDQAGTKGLRMPTPTKQPRVTYSESDDSD
ncbi:unnamed protein product [Brassicogethes aeneus]|uniref:ATP-dependent DNA helicase n=1 Tax=Brassicogethes aeneus TaxID=1431903 RepID=A0A9P0FQ58_BRAAE|nr:unnamed protein product [Brassicogethes aeneus]